MKPGRELDALVAEKVMNWSRITPTGKESLVNYFGWYSWGKSKPEYQYIARIKAFNPSTNMNRAWDVIRELSKRGHKVEVTQTETHSFCTIFDSCYAIAEVESASNKTPYAICLAALKAVGYNLEETR